MCKDSCLFRILYCVHINKHDPIWSHAIVPNQANLGFIIVPRPVFLEVHLLKGQHFCKQKPLMHTPLKSGHYFPKLFSRSKLHNRIFKPLAPSS